MKFYFKPTDYALGMYHCGSDELRFNLGHFRYRDSSCLCSNKFKKDNDIIKILVKVFEHEYLHKAICDIVFKGVHYSKKKKEWLLISSVAKPRKLLNQDGVVCKMQGINMSKLGECLF